MSDNQAADDMVTGLLRYIKEMMEQVEQLSGHDWYSVFSVGPYTDDPSAPDMRTSFFGRRQSGLSASPLCSAAG